MRYTTDNQAASRLVAEFDSYEDFLRYTEASTPDGTRRDYFGEMSRAWGGFCGSEAQVFRLARGGWAEGEALVAKFSDALFAGVSSLIERPAYFYDVEGADFDVARVLEGEPECWIDSRPEFVDGRGSRIVRLVLNGWGSCSVDAEVIKARGAAVVALAQLLEFSGIGCELSVSYVHGGHGGRYAASLVPIKAAGQPVDVARAAFALAHPAAMRGIMFGSMHHWPEWARVAFGANRYYGTPLRGDVDKAHQGDVFIGGANYGEPHWTDTQAAQDWIVAELKRQGVTLAESEGTAMPAVPVAPYVAPPAYRPIRRRRRRYLAR